MTDTATPAAAAPASTNPVSAATAAAGQAFVSTVEKDVAAAGSSVLNAAKADVAVAEKALSTVIPGVEAEVKSSPLVALAFTLAGVFVGYVLGHIA